MTTLVDDPLIAGMSIDRMLPLHESSRRLRELYPECPRVYGVAVMGDVSIRRWWPLESAVSTDRLQTMFDAAVADRTDAAPQAIGRDAGPRRHRPRDPPARPGGARVGHRPGEPVGARRLGRWRSTGWASSTRPCARCPTTPISPTATARRGIGAPAERGRADDLGRTPQPPRAGTAVRQAACGQRRRDVRSRRCGTSSGVVVAPRRRCRCSPARRTRRDAPRAGRARRAGRLRRAGARPVGRPPSSAGNPC